MLAIFIRLESAQYGNFFLNQIRYCCQIHENPFTNVASLAAAILNATRIVVIRTNEAAVSIKPP